VFDQSNGPSTAALLANVGRTPLCFVDIGGRFAQTLAQGGQEAMTDFALDWLTKLYGGDIRKTVRSTQATQWIKDPLVLGGWSSAVPGAQQARRVLMEPLRDRVWFAGEAVHETAWGTVNGAWESGERAAEAALRKMGALKEPERPKREQKRGSRRQQR
jgi:monoamine oxidase